MSGPAFDSSSGSSGLGRFRLRADLTPAQREAVISTAADICVTAAAGSGKTTVLTERFAWLCAEAGVAPDSILAVSYTKKSAEQLKDRIAKRLRESGIDPGDLGFVGTLHSVCLKILREYAVDAGLDPAFTPIEATATAFAQEECLEELLDEVMAADAGRYAVLWDWLSAGDLRRTIRALYERWRASGKPPLRAAGGDPAEAAAEWRALVSDLAQWLAGVDAAARDKYYAGLEAPDPEAAEAERIEWLQELRNRLKGHKLTKAGKERGAQDWWDRAEEIALRNADLRLKPAIERIAELLERFDRAYAERKRRASWLDLDDLLEHAARLLERPDFAPRFRKRFAALMTDEYQDINDAQAKLIDAVGRGLRVLAVGDARQSIYRFRYAESSHFLERAAAAGSGESGSRHVVRLAQNHRSRPGVLEWVNRLFEGREFARSHPFGRLEACRKPSDAPAPAVECRWFCKESDRTRTEDVTAREAEWVADRIRTLLETPAENGRPDPLRPRDIAILMRTKTHFDVFEAALRRRGIPYHTTGGSGFWDKPEVTDLVSLLTAVSDPDDRIAAAAAARSPFGGLNDESLVRIFGGNAGAAWLPRLEAFAAGEGEQARAAARFGAWFGRLREQRSAMSVSRILREAMEASAFEAMLGAQEDGRRRLGNIRKLLDRIAECERVFGPGIRKALRYLKLVREFERREEEASLAGPRANAVRILSVHASKGLEFPVVFAAGLGSRPDGGQDGSPFCLDRSGTIVGRTPDEGMTILKEGGCRYREWRDVEDELEDEEHRRLLYVALTRAEERLILTGEKVILKNPPKKNILRPWSETILAAFPDLEVHSESCAAEYAQTVRRRAGDTPADVRQPASVPAGAFSTTASAEAVSDVTVRADTLRKRLSVRRKVYRQTLDLSVSALAGQEGTNPAEVHPEVNKAFEIPAIAEMDDAFDSAGGTVLEASTRGSLFHEMVQRARLDADPAAEVARLTASFRDRVDASAAAMLERQLKDFFDSDLAARLRASEKERRPIQRELPFLYRVRSPEEEMGFVRGQADLLYEGTDGIWTLVDYKTGAEGRPEHEEQMRIYAFCLRKLLAGRPHRAELYYARSGKRVEVALETIQQPAFEAELVGRYEKLKAEMLGKEAK